MELTEYIITALGFILIGIPAGYFAFLIFRISIHQKMFKWSGSLSVVVTLCGGGFLTYLSNPFHFGLYSIGFFIGFVIYLRYLRGKYLSNKDKKLLKPYSSLQYSDEVWEGDEVKKTVSEPSSERRMNWDNPTSRISKS